MNDVTGTILPRQRQLLPFAAVLARWFLGGMFIYMGLSKALHPIEFLKLVRQYDVVHHHITLNAIAAVLPWFEIVCGILLVLGIAVRGSSLVVATMLVGFTVLIACRAYGIYAAGQLAFCAIKFDCGCGAGEVFVCRKLVENAVLLALSVVLIFLSRHRLCLWPGLRYSAPRSALRPE